METQLEELNQKEKEEALKRYGLLRLYLEQGIPLNRVAKHHNIPLRTLQRWLAHYYRDGVRGLIRKPRIDRGKHPHIPKEIQQEVERLVVQSARPSIAHVHRRIAMFAEQHNWPIPSYRTVASILRSILEKSGHSTIDHPKASFVLFDKSGRGRSKAIIRSKQDMSHWQAHRPNEIWQVDHILLDLWVRTLRHNVARPWLTTIIDDYSRAIVGFFVGLQIEAERAIALSLHQAIQPKHDRRWHIHGVPEYLRLEYPSKPRIQDLEIVAKTLEMGIIHQGTQPGKGQVEQFFREVTTQFISKFPTYGREKKEAIDTPLTIPVLEDQLHDFFVDIYNKQPHPVTGLAPQAQWEAGNFAPRLPTLKEHLDLLLLPVPKPRLVHRSGIHFLNLIYYHPLLRSHVGQLLLIRYNPRDLAEINVYKKNLLLCRAQCQELNGHNISIYDLQNLRKSYNIDPKSNFDTNISPHKSNKETQ